MKCARFILCISLLPFCLLLSAQNTAQPWAFTATINALDHLSPIDNFTLFSGKNLDQLTYGGTVGIFRNINPYLNVGIPLKVGKADVRVNDSATSPIIHQTAISADVVAQIGLFKSSYRINPFLQTGVGYQLHTGNDLSTHALAIPLGLGINVKITDKFYFQLQTEYRFVSKDKLDHLVYSAGISIPFGNKIDEAKDTDGDGVVDLKDDCPLLAGSKKLEGCPDMDNDGIADKNDVCPEQAGLAQFNGCPDRDGDGVPDHEDKCPEVKGLVSNYGCPPSDSDGDGILDVNDNCPNEPGPASNGGCPEEIGDSDGDGVPDNQDRCPNNVGPISNSGCPEISIEDRQILTFIVENLEFETGKATLKQKSYSILDQLVELMSKYYAYNLSIDGHTDSIGNSETNQVLSERRAKSAFDYLVLKGVDPQRMEYKGYGESMPIADNKYKEGREKNRRVEFNLFLK